MNEARRTQAGKRCRVSASDRQQKLSSLLQFDSALAGHPLIDPEELKERRDRDRAELHARNGWWHVRVEVLEIGAPEQRGQDLYRQARMIETNQPRLTRGDVDASSRSGSSPCTANAARFRRKSMAFSTAARAVISLRVGGRRPPCTRLVHVSFATLAIPRILARHATTC